MDADSVWRPAEQPVTDAKDADEIEAAERKMRQLTLQPSDTACKFRNRRGEMYVENKGTPQFLLVQQVSASMTLSLFFFNVVHILYTYTGTTLSPVRRTSSKCMSMTCT